MGYLKWFRNHFAKGAHNGYRAFSLGNVDSHCIHYPVSLRSIIFKLATIVFSLPIQIAWSHEPYSGRMADCLAAGHG